MKEKKSKTYWKYGRKEMNLLWVIERGKKFSKTKH